MGDDGFGVGLPLQPNAAHLYTWHFDVSVDRLLRQQQHAVPTPVFATPPTFDQSAANGRMAIECWDAEEKRDAGTPQHRLILGSLRPDELQCVSSATNPTNDVVLDTRMARPRASVVQLSLASLELPKLTQRNVERDWNRLYFRRGGWQFRDAADLDARQLRVLLTYCATKRQSCCGKNSGPAPCDDDTCPACYDDGGDLKDDAQEVVATLPLATNPIVAVAGGGTTEVTLTFQDPHGLSEGLVDTWAALATSSGHDGGRCPQQRPLRIVGTQLDATAPSGSFVLTPDSLVDIVDETRIVIRLDAPIVWAAPVGIFGYLVAPPVATSENLALLLSASFPDTCVQVAFVPRSGRFAVRVRPPYCHVQDFGPCDTRHAGPCASIGPPHLVVPSALPSALPVRLGFAVCVAGPDGARVPIVSSTFPNDVVDTRKGRSAGACAADCLLVAPRPPRDECFVCVPPGDYLAAMLTGLLNRFSFEDGPVDFTFRVDGLTHVISVPPGQYGPDQVALVLQTAMQSAVPQAQFQVTWDPGACRMTFQSVAGYAFDFVVEDMPVLAERLGLLPNAASGCAADHEPCCFRGERRYTTPVLFGCCACATACPADVVTVRFDELTRSLVFAVCPPNRTLASLPVADGTDITFQEAHGLCVGDTVQLQVASDGIPAQSVWAVVVEVVDAFQVVVDFGGVASPVDGLAVTLVTRAAPFSLLLARDACHRPFALHPRVLGFPHGVDVNVCVCLRSPACIDLGHVSFLLLVVDDPKGQTRGEHYAAEDGSNVPNVLAKIELFPTLRLERMLPMSMYLPQGLAVPRVRMRLLNPDHSLYQLHGHTWSGSINFAVAQHEARLMCF